MLSTGSPVLAAMFQHDLKESQSRVIEIADISPKVFQEVLRFLYSGTAKEMDGMAMDLLVAADKYQIDALKNESASILVKNLAVDNATKILVLAHLHSCPKLFEETLDFMSKNSEAICSRSDWMTVITNYPELAFQATQKMVLTRKKIYKIYNI